jgi:hypothetical protein
LTTTLTKLSALQPVSLLANLDDTALGPWVERVFLRVHLQILGRKLGKLVR